MPLDPEFVADCPYGPEGLFIDEVVEIDRAGHGRLVLRAPTHEDLPLTSAQRVHPERHPRHVAGGLLLHMTGIAGFAHAYYCLGLRHGEGWIGYGAKISSARFVSLARMGEPILIDCKATQLRRGAAKAFVRYEFRFTQGPDLIYEGDQTAIFMKV
jgi:hypothetical protein